MQAPGDNTITVVDPQTYADTNLNEKNLGTQYIYTTEGQLIPASEDHTTENMDLNSQHYNTVNVTEAQNIQIQQVEYQYEQQYPDGTVQQIVPVTDTEIVHDQSNTFIIEQPAYVAPTSEETHTTECQVYTTEVVTSQHQPTTYEYSQNTEISETHTTNQPVISEQEASTEAIVNDNIEEPSIPAEDVQNQTSQEEPNVQEVSDTGESTVQPEEAVAEPVSVEKPNEDITKETVNTPTEESISAAETDQSDIENLKKNPAVEVQNDESIETNEEETETLTVEEKTSEVSEQSSDTNNDQIKNNEETTSQEAPTSVAEVVLIAESSIENLDNSETVRTSRPRGRKAKSEIPLHILGHDVNKPMDNVVNGKTPKPRLGVKVPYRNLTSQIVSKAEIENEIFERGRKKQEEKEEKQFARQLTSRLASRIAPSGDGKGQAKTSKSGKKSEKNDANQMEIDTNGNEERDKTGQDTLDNSDLLAILEGDGDTEEISELVAEPQTKNSSPSDETNLKNLEREIALQQLQDLPYLSPKTKIVKGNKYKASPGNVASANEKTSATSKSQLPKSPIKNDVLKLEVEPQIKVNMTLKTYSRKRKSSEGVVESTPSPTKKTNVEVSTADIDLQPSMQPPAQVYVTKSSRIIKKKVIWDPDENSSSKPKVSPMKAEASPQPKIIQKPAQSKNENKTADLPKKSAGEVKAKSEKKVEEKPSPKKATIAEKKASPGTSKAALKTKKPRTEVDRLLGDEGAIKMLYDLKNSESAIDEKRKKTVFSVEKTFKELAKKANQIKSDLVNNSTGGETPKNLRKKEPAISPVSVPKPAPPASVSTPAVPAAVSRQKSKDSARSTPPPSPAYTFSNEVSYLVRRRSSSSISSVDDTGGSLDFDDSEDRLSKKRPVNTPSDPLKIKKKKNNSESEKSEKRAENRIGQYKTFSFKKTNKSVAIDLHTDENKGCYFTSELLSELTTALTKISKEKDCNVVLITSSKDDVFSYGLNYKDLVSDKESTRKNKANELADRVRNFIQCLMNFPKVLVAGIQGDCVGLAVTMLPLFDIVIASDNAQFSSTCSSMGCIPEAGFLLTVPYVSSSGLAAELFYASQKLTADEVYRRGLISKLCWPEKYQDTIKSTVSAISQGSKQSLLATKTQLRSNMRGSCEEAIDSMVTDLVDHWTSTECQSNFAELS